MWLGRAVQQRIHDLNQEMEARISVAIEAVEADLRYGTNLEVVLGPIHVEDPEVKTCFNYVNVQ
jgi:hypothetical protein